MRSKARSYFLIGADHEDIVQEGMIGLYKAIRDFKPEKLSSFRAFAEVCAGKQHIEYNQIASVKAYSRTKLSFMVECGQRPESGMSRPACVAVNKARAQNT